LIALSSSIEITGLVTMICNSTSSNKPATSSSGNNHAVLAVEGIKKTGEAFRQILHLIGPFSHKQPNEVIFKGGCCYAGMLRIGEVKTSNVKFFRYTHKSETWIRSADKARAMRHVIKEERDNPAAFPRPFSIFGNRSLLTRDLKTFKITNPLLLTKGSDCGSMMIQIAIQSSFADSKMGFIA